jgi:hypothetical protein
VKIGEGFEDLPVLELCIGLAGWRLIFAYVEQQEYFLIFAEEPGLHRSGGDQEKDSYADK